MESQCPPHSKISFGISLSCQPTLSVSRKSRSPICEHGAPLTAPKQADRQRHTPINQIFLCPSSVVSYGPSVVKSHMECLCRVKLPCQCLGRVDCPNVTFGAPLTAKKQTDRDTPQVTILSFVLLSRLLGATPL